MPSSSKTTHGLQLSQFQQNDCPKWLDDYNADMAKIDQGVSQKAPINHATSSTNYGVATTTQYGHIRLQDLYPVGAIYESTSSTSPASLFGGTWESYGAGRVLVGINTSDANFNSIGKTGGASTHKLSTAELARHGHSTPSGHVNVPHNGSGVFASSDSQYLNYSFSTSQEGNDVPHNNLQPYIVVYRWRRTA